MHRLGFIYCRQRAEVPTGWMTRTITEEVVFVGVPHWAVFLVLAVLPARRAASALAGLRARIRRKRGCCRRCGYDLRATPGRCPEMFSPLQSADVTFFAPCDAPRVSGDY
jgi:hypothetical protein